MPTQDDDPNSDSSQGQQLRSDWQGAPKPDRFDPDRDDYARCLAAHEQAMAKGSLGYLDPVSGLFVMTALYLRDRGWCCDRGCRHCPYDGQSDKGRSTGERPKSTGATET